MDNFITENTNFMNLLQEISGLITTTKQNIRSVFNNQLALLYWNVGKVIKTSVFQDHKAEYGKQIIEALGQKLSSEFGRGVSARNLFNMISFYEAYPDFSILQTASAKLSYSHFIELARIEDHLKREFYLRDPYILDFLGLKDTYDEKDLENAILAELEKFILEMGIDFAFLARQKRIIVDGRDYYIDLLFYHRKMKRLVVIELKIDEFKPEHKGQMELYLNG
jgi:predicted nuclease of restriction endonuclease-like (RecB) superfamily